MAAGKNVDSSASVESDRREQVTVASWLLRINESPDPARLRPSDIVPLGVVLKPDLPVVGGHLTFAVYIISGGDHWASTEPVDLVHLPEGEPDSDRFMRPTRKLCVFT